MILKIVQGNTVFITADFEDIGREDLKQTQLAEDLTQQQVCVNDRSNEPYSFIKGGDCVSHVREGLLASQGEVCQST